MKHNLLYYAVSAMLLGGSLASCSSDSIINSEPQVVDKDTDFYIRVDIANPLENSTRANTNLDPTDYVDGTEDEMKIHEILFIFYNSEMQYVGKSTYKPTTPDKGGTETGKPGSIETVLSITVPVSVSAGSLKPAYVMAYVNPATGYNDQQRPFASTLGLTRTLEEMTNQPGDALAGIKAHSGYTMTNSVYYDGEEPSIAVPISDDQLCVVKKDADDAVLPEDNTGEIKKKEKVIIYVERVVAKVNLKKADGVTDIAQTNNTVTDAAGVKYTLNFNVLGWGLSNLEKGTFLVKNFRTGSNNCTNFEVPFLLTNMTYTDANKTFGLTSPDWNFASTTQKPAENWGISGHRSFWALSPTYFTGAKYPSYADEYDGNENNYALVYRSANDIYELNEDGTGTKGNYGDIIGTTQYTLEHTMEASVVTNHQKRAVTCAIVLGQYSFTKAGETTPVSNQDFYIRSGINNEGKDVNIFYAGDKQLKQAYLEKNTKIYYEVSPKVGDTPATYAPIPWNDVEGKDNPNLANFVIVHPSSAVTNGIETPNRYVSLQLVEFDKITAGTTYYLQDANGNMNIITADNIAQANAALYENLNGVMSGVSKFNQGLAYFSVPIMHLWGRATTDKQIGDPDFSAKLGQYGIVRNHSYTIGVKSIDGIGTAIGDPEAPIIPNVNTETYYVNAQMRVQRWRVVPVQDVVLKP